jgi:hypothetical protein
VAPRRAARPTASGRGPSAKKSMPLFLSAWALVSGWPLLGSSYPPTCDAAWQMFADCTSCGGAAVEGGSRPRPRGGGFNLPCTRGPCPSCDARPGRQGARGQLLSASRGTVAPSRDLPAGGHRTAPRQQAGRSHPLLPLNAAPHIWSLQWCTPPSQTHTLHISPPHPRAPGTLLEVRTACQQLPASAAGGRPIAAGH